MTGFYRFAHALVGFLLRLLPGFEVIDARKVPAGGAVIIACNHISVVDPPVVGCALGRPIHYMAKKELFTIVILGPIIRALNAFPVDRAILDRRALARSEQVLHDGGGLLLFPEGTRSRSGRLGRGRPGIGMLARRVGVAIVPAYLENTQRFLRTIFSRRKIRVRFGEPMDADLITSFPDSNDGYRAITQEVMRRIEELGKNNR